jgi:hypothetical protein
MPSIAIGPEEEEEEDEEEGQAPESTVWATSCALGGRSTVVAGADDDDEESSEPEATPSSAPSAWHNKRFIFLEIDGILNTRPEPRMIFVEKALCKQLRRLLDTSGAEIVLTTSWRRHHEYISEVLYNFGALPDHGMELHRAPWNANPERRDLEILQWVSAHPGIAGWVALDARDLLRFPSAPRLQGHTIQINPLEGLTGDVVTSALQALGCQSGKNCGRSAAVADPIPSKLPAVTPATDLVGVEGTSSLKKVEEDLAGSLRSAFSWDADLAGKMETLLGNLPTLEKCDNASPGYSANRDVAIPQSEASRAEFQAVIAAARSQFHEEPAK